ncbi:MAG TPA: hydrogenase maturation protease [Armatimonadetes bacterium]|nr:hydrogenase maturation protease [Armatimonadota bacterium]
MAKIVVLGIGNLLMRDDGVGVHVINALRKCNLPNDVEVVDGGILGIDLLSVVEDADMLIVIDAVDVGASPGEIVELSDDLLAPSQCPMSLHDFRIGDVLRIAEMRGKRPRCIVLIGIQVADVSCGDALSPQLAVHLDNYVQTVFEKLNAYRTGA